MNMTKRIAALLLALVMALSLSTMAFADGTTTTDKVTHTTVNSIDYVESVTIAGVQAYYENDSNVTDKTFIRALVTNGTEYSLKHATVVLNLSNTAAEVETTIPFSRTGATLTATDVDLFNKAYDVTIKITSEDGVVTDSKTYKLAAGLPSGTVAINANDPLRIISIVVGDATDTAITATNVQNPLMGNTVSNKDGKWTFINYKVNASLNTVPASRDSVAVALSLTTGTTLSGCYNEEDGTLDLSGAAPKLILTNGSESRNYYVFATDTNTFEIEYGFDFTEALASSAYQNGDILDEENEITVTDAVDDLIDRAHAYFGTENDNATYGTIMVTAGQTVMDIMHEFAVANQLESEVPEGCTYMATLNGVGEFTFGPMSGWMYTNGPTWVNGVADFTKWNTPPIGAASYTLSEGDTICWFICCDYTHHPW